MIHVRKGDVRNGLSVGSEMEDLELEEGEACCYENNNSNNACDNDSIIDPEIALSYIDEKIQHVLGHFQKDFEGMVTPEILGSKYGCYGSFLPTYQRSPPVPDLKTALEVPSNTITKSPKITLYEGGRHNSCSSSSTFISTKSVPTSTNSLLVPATRAPIPNPGVNLCKTPAIPEECASICKTLQKPADASEQKSLKVRIRVGSENLSSTKNAELYSGLGLDVSPSSSLDNSPTDSEDIFHRIQDAPDKSPTSILQIMTSSPMRGSLLLSPLSDDLIHLTEKDWHWRKCGAKPMHETGADTSGAVANGFDSIRGSKKISGDRKKNLHEKDAIVNGYISGDNLPCEELISRTMKLPLLSKSISSACYPVSGSKTNDNLTTSAEGITKEESIDHTAKEDLHHVSPAENNAMVDKSNGIVGLCVGGLVNEKSNNFDYSAAFPRKENNECAEQADDLSNPGCNKCTKDPNTDKIGFSRPSVASKMTLKKEVGMRLVKKQVSSGSKKKLGGIQIHDAREEKLYEDGLVTNSFSAHKTKRSSSGRTSASKSHSKGVKNHSKARDSFTGLSGKLEAEKDDYKSFSEGTHSLEMLKGSDSHNGTNLVECSDVVKEISKASEVEKRFALTEHHSVDPNIKTVTVIEPNPTSAPVAEDPLVNEDWVQCDKCHKWRLLPLGTDPESFSKNWLCKMLDWLPGLNRCSISEDETTMAVRALYQFPAAAITTPASESQTKNQNEHHQRSLVGLSSVDVLHSDLENRSLGLQIAVASGKKNHGSKDSSYESKQAGMMPSSSKNNNFKEIANGGLNDSVNSSAGENGHKKYYRHSSAPVAEKQDNKLKVKKRLLDSRTSDGGGNNVKTKNKSETDLVNSRTSKKVKRDSLLHNDENWTTGKAWDNGPSTSSGMVQTVSQDQHKYKYRDSKTSDKNFQVHNPVNSSDESLHASKSYSKDSSKKRKRNGSPVNSGDGSLHTSRSDSKNCSKRKGVRLRHSEIYSKPVPFMPAETCENDGRKGREARDFNPEVKHPIGNKFNEGKDERSRNKDQQIAQYQAMDSTKRHPGILQPSMTATSSSSKVSGSQKNKSNPLELRASPVESVSSSPLRIPGVVGENGGGSNMSGMVMKDGTWDAHNDSHDRQEVHLGNTPIVKMNLGTVPVSLADCENKVAGNLPLRDQNAFKLPVLEEGEGERRSCGPLHDNNGTTKKNSGKGSSSKPKDKTRTYKYELDRLSGIDSLDQMPSSSEKLKAGKIKFGERTANHSDKTSAKDHSDTFLNGSVKEEVHLKLADNNGRYVKADTISGLDKGQVLVPNRGDESCKNYISGRTNGLPTSVKGKPLQPLPTRSQNEIPTLQQLIPGSKKESANLMPADEFEYDASRARDGKKSQSHSRDQHNVARHSTPTLNKVRDVDAPSAVQKDSPSQAASSAVKEAKNLKHVADRLQNSGSSDSTGFYFQAALKFLTGAALYDSCNTNNVKHIEMTRAMYIETADLCKFCAHEYERSKEMAAAALAYKCMEVAYMRVIYSSHSDASRYRTDLQEALQIFAPGESSSSSASDIDNLNNPLAVDKGGLTKSAGSAQVTGAHFMTPETRFNITQMLKFVQEVSLAMEASKSSRAALAAASSKIGDNKSKDGISSVKMALDFNFQDMDGLLRLVRVAMEEINS
ncbi:unnamed protein product [Cuscuta epithymum]|uniref:CW-type domain-containing protein n=1 Tax=Cuscuta epithymum TaxID=186058 RepID=A0AAV0FZR1_9ASTE|nr:unnamed protein product [Cuscuta epithymum]